jgi:hypothetical protein
LKVVVIPGTVMSRKATNISRAANRLVIVSPLVVEYQSEQLVAVCRRLAALKQFLLLGETASLIDAPVGRYYEALAKNDWGADPARFDVARLYTKHQPRALLSIAQALRHQGDARYAMTVANESCRLAIDQQDWFTALNAHRETAVGKSVAGDHRGALSVLEAGLTSVTSLRGDIATVALVADYYNSLAVELGELGRIEEARLALRVALASPCANAYPEWRETFRELEVKARRVSRSTVAISQGRLGTLNLIALPPRRVGSGTTAVTRESRIPARVIKFPTRSSQTPNQGKNELNAGEKRRIMLDHLYDMFRSALQENPIDNNLFEKLYGVFLENRKKN